MAQKRTKAYLTKQLRKKGITIPKGLGIDALEHRLSNYLPGDGFIIRLAKPSSRRPGHPVTLLTDKNTIYWVPNSIMAQQIILSKLVFVMGRSTEPPNNTTTIEVPSDYEKVFGNGGNNNTDS